MAHLSISEMFLRVLLAFLAGVIVGWERESHGRPAGLRTTILACVASAVAMIISEALFVQSAATTAGSNWRPDPARLGAGILTGIGFLGAGTILRQPDAIRGVTTAASLWFVTVLGLAFGSGQFALGAIGVAVALVTLFILPRFEKHIPSDWYSTLSITTRLDAISADDLKKRIEADGAVVKSIHLVCDLENQQQTLICDVKLKKSQEIGLSKKVVGDLRQYPGVLKVQWT